MSLANPTEFRVRFDWGPMGVRCIAPEVDVVVIVGVLSFTTCVDIALGRGAEVFPYKWHDGSGVEFAASVGAELAHRRDEATGWSLSPVSLSQVPAGSRLVLPSA